MKARQHWRRALLAALLLAAASSNKAADRPSLTPPAPARLATPKALTVLPVEQAFRLSTPLVEDGRIRIHFQIEQNHYLYQQKLQVFAEDGHQLPLELPPAVTLVDEFEGESKVYFKELDLTAALGTPPHDRPLQLTLVFQGCAKDRYCYPLVSRKITAVRRK